VRETTIKLKQGNEHYEEKEDNGITCRFVLQYLELKFAHIILNKPHTSNKN